MNIKLNLVKLTFGFNKRSFSYFHNVGKFPLKYITLGRLLEYSAKKYEDKKFLISSMQKKSITFKEALENCDKLAAGLLSIGLQKGDRIGLWCPNLIEWVTVMFACSRAGLIMVALNPDYQVPELEYSINKVGIKCLICPEESKNRDYYKKIKMMISDLERQDTNHISSKNCPTLKNIITISEKKLRGTLKYEEIANCSDEQLLKQIKTFQDHISPDETFSILFSSGTTGKPKATVVSHFSYVNNSFMIGQRLELDKKNHRICMMVPLFHVFGINITTYPSLWFGSTIVIPSPTYSSSANLTAMKEERCTMIHGTPTMHFDLMSEQQKRNENIIPEIAVSGGAPLSCHQIQKMLKVLKLKSVKSMYGLTETTAVVFASHPEDNEEESMSTLGCLGEHMEAKVIDTHGNIVPFGKPGELCIRGYPNMKGYWDDIKKTEDTIDSNGWLRTGDQFIMNEKGYGQIVGRLKDMIIRGGENIFPKEIEDILITHPDIFQAYVIGLPHERLGEEVCACVELLPKTSISLESLTDFCRGKISHFKIPTKLKVMDDFPKTSSGKIQKYILQQRFSSPPKSS